MLQPPVTANASPQRADAFDCITIEVGELSAEEYDYVHLGCSFLGNSSFSDRISIYSRAGLNVDSSDWREIAGLDNETWIFDYQNNAAPDLVIRFYSDNDVLFADLYDRETLGGRVDDIGLLDFVENQIPKIHVFSQTGSWQSGETINYNLDILVDGAVLAIPSSEDFIKDIFAFDGNTDLTIGIRDLDFDGRPDFDFRRISALIENPSRSLNQAKSYLMVNSKDNEASIEPVFPWPYLGNVTYGYLTSSPHAVSQPPIQMDWQAGRIYAIGEFVSSRGNDSQWFVYSFSDIEAGKMNNPNFESPFAWYDLAGDQDRQAELAVRFGYYPKNDPVFVRGTSDDPVNIVRYSWDQDNDGLWDYKLGLLGKNEVTTEVTLANIGLRILPYETIPGWINEQAWGAVTFVAAENGGVTGEGIYVWDHPAWFTEGYFLGRADSPLPPVENETPIEFGYGRIQAGYRGEYNNEYLGKIGLYLSPIDQKIHLKNLTEGFWNIDDHQLIRYKAVNSEFVDQWEKYRDGELIETNYFLSGYLLSAGETSLNVTKTSLPLSSVEFSPPATRQEWVRISSSIDQSTQLEPFQQSPSDPSSLYTDVHIANVRSTPSGFRFEIGIGKDIQTTGTDLFGIDDANPGKYVIEFDNDKGSFQRVEAKPATPEILEFAPLATPSCYFPVEFGLRILNPGNVDLKELHLVILAINKTDVIQVEQKRVDLYAGEIMAMTSNWIPKVVGDHEIRITLSDDHENAILVHSIPVSVKASEGGTLKNTLLVSTRRNWIPTIFVLLLIAFIASGLNYRLAEEVRGAHEKN